MRYPGMDERGLHVVVEWHEISNLRDKSFLTESVRPLTLNIGALE